MNSCWYCVLLKLYSLTALKTFFKFFSGKAQEAMLQYKQGLNLDIDTDHLRYCREGIARCLIKCGNAKKGIDIALEIGSNKLLSECAELLENTKV